MEITTKEVPNSKDSNEQSELIIKEIEINFDEMIKTIPEEITEEIQVLINKFITIIKEQEALDKSHLQEKIGPLNTIINTISQKIKNFKGINDESKKSLSQIKKLMYKLNSILNNPSIITKSYINGKYKGDFLNNKREGKGTYIYSNAVWVLLIRLPFTNRFAYLSWFLYAIVLAYPLFKFHLWRNQGQKVAMIMMAHVSFTFLMCFYTGL